MHLLTELTWAYGEILAKSPHDLEFLLAAKQRVYSIGTAARARGMTAVAKDSGLAREFLYKALRPDSSPRFETVVKVMRAFGVRLVAQPIHDTKSEVIS